MLIKDVNRRPPLSAIMNSPFFQPYIDNLTNAKGETLLDKLKKKVREEEESKTKPVKELEDIELEYESVFLPYRYPTDEEIDMKNFDIKSFLQTLIPPTVKPRIDSNKNCNQKVMSETKSSEMTDDLVYTMTVDNTVRFDIQPSDGSEDVQEEYPDSLDDEPTEKQQMIQHLVDDAKGEFGEKVYSLLYELLKQLRSQGETDDIIRDQVEAEFGEDVADNFYMVDQIVYFESQ